MGSQIHTSVIPNANQLGFFNSRINFDTNTWDQFDKTFKPHANGRNFVGQQLPTLLDVTRCVRLHTLLHVVACCWELLRKG